MQILKLFIKDFMGHSFSEIDFREFSSALIIGKIEGKDQYSNGVGKSTIFKAIEYILFNQSDFNLEKIIRDDCQSCLVALDFELDENVYRVVRKRSKSVADLSIFKYKQDASTNYPFELVKEEVESISSRTNSHTEKDLAKLIKLNYNAFRSTSHFVQNDMSGIATTTKEKRKVILKEALQLSVYSKLEKLAKDKASDIKKKIDNNTLLVDSIGDPQKNIDIYFEQINKISLDKNNLLKILLEKTSFIDNSKLEISKLENQKVKFETELMSNNNLITSMFNEVNSITKEVNNITAKRNELISLGKEENVKYKSYKEMDLDVDKLNNLSNNEQLNKLQEEYNNLSVNIKITNNDLLKLKDPIILTDVCKTCRQPLTQEHVDTCNNEDNLKREQLVKDLNKFKSNELVLKEKINNLSKLIDDNNRQINLKNKVKNDMEHLKKSLIKNKETYEEFNKLLTSAKDKLNQKQNELDELKLKIDDSKVKQLESIKDKIKVEKNNLNNLNNLCFEYSNQVKQFEININVLESKIKDNKDKILDKEKLLEENNKFQQEYKNYPNVIQAYSSSGIPALITNSILDELQLESNKILDKIKPGLSLSFIIEKENSKKEISDTLDINYFINGRSRDYEQLSGAQKLSVMFALKLGLSFVLKNIIGADIKFLLLDEIDQSLDKAGVEAFAEIIKEFQKDFTILVITHNDTLKNKFSSGILVEQDDNMVSSAKLVSSW